MKSGKIIIRVTVILIAIYIFTFNYISKTNIKTVDVTRLNNVVKSIEKEFDKQQYNMPKAGVIDKMSYTVVFAEDENYNSVIFNAMKERSTIADLTYATDNESVHKIVGKVIFEFDDNEETIMKSNLKIIITATFLVMLIVVYVIFGIIYVRIIKPFAVMKQFAGKVAEGDLEFKLTMDKKNYFGAYTESFDLMREELMKAKQGEYEANISKKELVAELSHDIKTPVATIKAICELLEVKLKNIENSEMGNREIKNETDSSEIKNEIVIKNEMSNIAQKNEIGCSTNHNTKHDMNRDSIEKIEVIYNKADIIDKLISNMFHATLEELEMLKVEVSEQPSTIITQMFSDINHFDKINLKNSVAECLIKCDPLRLSQVIDNVISNSYKYAGTNIDIDFSINKSEKNLGIRIRDYGSGVNDNDLPLICEKFYRGSEEKVKNSSGSGLGLYLAKQFMEGMGGNFTCYNDGGFVVELQIKIV